MDSIKEWRFNNNGIIKNGIYVSKKDVLLSRFFKSTLLNYFDCIFGSDKVKGFSLFSPFKGNILSTFISTSFPFLITFDIIGKIQVSIGDKVSGRYGNKGVVSKVLFNEDMPYLKDGGVLDVLLNPLGIPSRMNIGQIFECLLGMAAMGLFEMYIVKPFDEIYGINMSNFLVLQKLLELKNKTGKKWLFCFTCPGKFDLIDGRNGNYFSFKVTFGFSYILKLVHVVVNKIHFRSIGPYSFISQQPTKGKRNRGGQRLGEMEFWALEGFGVSFVLQEGKN